MKANSTPTTVTWDSELSLDDRASINLAVRCTYDIEVLCSSMLELVQEVLPTEDTAMAAMIRMNATRIMKLNSVLMSQLDEDGVTLKTAYTTLYGVTPAEGSTP